jgi:hypothetical protein
MVDAGWQTAMRLAQAASLAHAVALTVGVAMGSISVARVNVPLVPAQVRRQARRTGDVGQMRAG